LDVLRKNLDRVRRPRIRARLGVARVGLQSRLFPPPPNGRFLPVWLASRHAFPPVLKADDRPHALLATGGKLTAETLLSAYARGIYPICNGPQIKWIVFNPRMVLFLERTRLEKNFRRILRSDQFRVSFDSAFEEVVRACSEREWTWLVPARVQVAVALHKQGRAHSVEVWNRDGDLVGGVFGVDMGRIFISESSFHRESNAGKVANAYLNCHLQHWGYILRDGQAYTPHLEWMGFEEMACREYVGRLKELTRPPFHCGPWAVDDQLDVAAWKPAMPGSQVKKPVVGMQRDG